MPSANADADRRAELRIAALDRAAGTSAPSVASARRPGRRRELARDSRRAPRASSRSAADTSTTNDGGRAVVDEVVADPVGPPRVAVGLVPPQAARKRRGVQHAAGADVIGMSIVPVRHRDRARTMPANQLRRPIARAPACSRIAAVRPAKVLAPAGARARRAASAASRRRSSGVPLLPSSPAVRSQSPTVCPAAACRAIVPARPISMSSGCGPKTSRSTATLVRR